MPHLHRRVNPWPDSMSAFLPADVKAASDTLRAAVDRLDAARAAASVRRADADGAREADRAAARAAVTAGKAVPKPSAPVAADALADAERVLKATEALAVDAQWAFVASQLAHLDATIATVRDRQAQIRDVLDSRLTEIAAGVRELAGLDHVIAELSGGVLLHRRSPSFRPVRPQPRRPRDLGEEAVAPIRATIAEPAPGNNRFVTPATAA